MFLFLKIFVKVRVKSQKNTDLDQLYVAYLFKLK